MVVPEGPIWDKQQEKVKKSACDLMVMKDGGLVDAFATSNVDENKVRSTQRRLSYYY